MQPLTADYVALLRDKLADFVSKAVKHTVHVTWRFKVPDDLEQPGDPVEWSGVASLNSQGAVQLEFTERPGYISSFPRADVDYMKILIKRTNQEMPGNPAIQREQRQENFPEQVAPQHPINDSSLTFFEMVSNTKIAAFTTVSGTKVLREPGKFSSLYPHIWVAKLEEESVGGVIAEWRSELTDLLAPIQARSESVAASLDHAKRSFTEWLRAVALGGPHLNDHLWRLGYAAIEQILFMIALSSRSSAGVIKMRGEIDEAWSKRIIDYPAMIKVVNALPATAATTTGVINQATRGRGRGWRGHGRGQSFRGRGGRQL